MVDALKVYTARSQCIGGYTTVHTAPAHRSGEYTEIVHYMRIVPLSALKMYSARTHRNVDSTDSVQYTCAVHQSGP